MTNENEITADTDSAWGVFSQESGNVNLTYTKIEYNTFLIGDTLDLLRIASESTGSYVELSPDFSFCPVLKDNFGGVLPLYKFIEILDEYIDYDEIKEEMPTFSFAQISGAISFLRKVAQFNMAGVDIDAEIDQASIQDPTFRRQLERLANQEPSHVLDLSQRHR